MIYWIFLENNFFDTGAMNFYNLKLSEYQGYMKPFIYNYNILSFPFRAVWNFLGIVGNIKNLILRPDLHLFFHIGPQLLLPIILFSQFKYILKNSKPPFFVVFAVVFSLLTALFPHPHTRYLYPLIVPYFIFMFRHDK